MPFPAYRHLYRAPFFFLVVLHIIVFFPTHTFGRLYLLVLWHFHCLQNFIVLLVRNFNKLFAPYTGLRLSLTPTPPLTILMIGSWDWTRMIDSHVSVHSSLYGNPLSVAGESSIGRALTCILARDVNTWEL